MGHDVKGFSIREIHGDVTIKSCGVLGPTMPHGNGTIWKAKRNADFWAAWIGDVEVVEVEYDKRQALKVLP